MSIPVKSLAVLHRDSVFYFVLPVMISQDVQLPAAVLQAQFDFAAQLPRNWHETDSEMCQSEETRYTI